MRLITKTRLFKYTENFTTLKKYEIFQIKNSDIFQNEAVLTGTQNLGFEKKWKNNVYPCKPQFYNIKVRFKRVNIIPQKKFKKKKKKKKKKKHENSVIFQNIYCGYL